MSLRHVCDRCGKVVDDAPPTLNLSVSQVDPDKDVVSFLIDVRQDLCPDCLQVVGNVVRRHLTIEGTYPASVSFLEPVKKPARKRGTRTTPVQAVGPTEQESFPEPEPEPEPVVEPLTEDEDASVGEDEDADAIDTID